MRRRIYIAGPMRGRPELNFPAFNVAAELFRAYGWEVVNPVDVGQELCGNAESVRSEDYVRADLRLLIDCTAIALLDGWEDSVGARCEAVVAMTLGLEFYDQWTSPMACPAQVTCCGGYASAAP